MNMVFTYKTGKDGLILKTKAKLVAKGFSQAQHVDFFPAFAPTPSSASVKIMAVANEYGRKIFLLDVAQAFVRATFTTKHTRNYAMGVVTCQERPLTSNDRCVVQDRADGNGLDYW